MNSNIKEIADALTKSKTLSEIKGEADRLVVKSRVLNKARSVILAEISKWVGFEVRDEKAIPVVRDGVIVKYLAQGLFSSNPIDPIIQAAQLEDTSYLKSNVEQLTQLISQVDALLSTLSGMTHLDRLKLQVKGGVADNHVPLEARLIGEIGSVTSAVISLDNIKKNAKSELTSATRKLADRNTGKGKPRNEAVYAITLELAKLFEEVTGEKITYGESKDGLHGKFTPSARVVLDSLGFDGTALKKPIGEAKALLKQKEDSSAHNGTLAGLLSGALN